MREELLLKMTQNDLNRLLEELAYLEHEQWCEWIKHMDKIAIHGKTTVEFANETWHDWIVKSNYDYEHLFPNQKESDRKFAQKVIEKLREWGRV